MIINNCPSCLKPGYNTFCIPCRKKLFGGRKISPILTFSKPVYEQIVLEQSGRISISGVQPKHSIKISNSNLELTEKGGEYIIKPHPNSIMNFADQVPANEHLTMQIASQIFGINAAHNALVFFKDSKEPCYLTKRFDRYDDGKKIQIEDFAQIAGKTEENDGIEYKYNLSYEEMAEILKAVCRPYPVEVEKYFKVIIFNYLVSNGDAHMKNFSLIKDISFNDYVFSPAYDLLNTRIHYPKDAEIALNLFKDFYETESYKINAHFLYEDFYQFGMKIGIKKNRVEKFLSDIVSRYSEIEYLLNNSFLNTEARKLYLECVRLNIEKLTKK
ncbi:MAG: HipA domain-containing protein [Ignavibacteria bacterium]|nr:HipA domain-containing protein [Ignavibacteria bacterium]